MLSIASNLSNDIALCRVDLYSIGCQIYFGEMTFYPGNGIELFSPLRYDLEFGKDLKLMEK